MSRAIGRTKSWLWWIGGAMCALVFAGAARAGEVVKAAARYGIRPGPNPVKPQVAVTEKQKERAGKLVDDFLAGRTGVEVTAEEKAKIAGLISDFGSDRFAVREAASRDVLKFGHKALPQLGAAAKHDDPEVAQRAETAIAVIRRTAAGGGTVGELRRMRGAAVLVITGRIKELRTAAYKAELQAIALKSQKREAEAAAKMAEKAAAGRKIGELNRLLGLLVNGGIAPIDRRRVQPAYGVPRPMPGVMLK